MALPYCTQNQFRPDQPFCSSYPDTLGIHLTRNCLYFVISKDGAICTVSQNWGAQYMQQQVDI